MFFTIQKLNNTIEQITCFLENFQIISGIPNNLFKRDNLYNKTFIGDIIITSDFWLFQIVFMTKQLFMIFCDLTLEYTIVSFTRQ